MKFPRTPLALLATATPFSLACSGALTADGTGHEAQFPAASCS